jgi:hypothetical protein
MPSQADSDDPGDLLGNFRSRYNHLENTVNEVLLAPTDVVILAGIGDDLDALARLAIEVCFNLYTLQVDERWLPRLQMCLVPKNSIRFLPTLL